jgi:hypothetical protein
MFQAILKNFDGDSIFEISDEICSDNEAQYFLVIPRVHHPEYLWVGFFALHQIEE